MTSCTQARPQFLRVLHIAYVDREWRWGNTSFFEDERSFTTRQQHVWVACSTVARGAMNHTTKRSSNHTKQGAKETSTASLEADNRPGPVAIKCRRAQGCTHAIHTSRRCLKARQRNSTGGKRSVKPNRRRVPHIRGASAIFGGFSLGRSVRVTSIQPLKFVCGNT